MKAKLVIVADRGTVKAYKLNRTTRGSPHLDLLEEMALDQAHHRMVEAVSDLAGRRAGSSQRNWSAPLADPHNLELETERRLIRKIAARIVRLSDDHADLGLWLATPKEIHNQIMDELPDSVRQRIEGNLSRNLVKAEKAELLEYFAPAAE